MISFSTDLLCLGLSNFSSEGILHCHYLPFPLQGVKSKNKLILRLMEQLVYPNPAAYRDKLIRFSTLNHTNYSEVGSHCSVLLILRINN